VSWPPPTELRIGLGCMRIDDDLAAETIAAAVEAGITIFDTAHAYGSEPGQNERLLAGALRACGAAGRGRIVTKGGMTRPGGAWIPDGRAKVLQADCEASLEALGGLPIDLYLVHAPDPRTPWSTTVRGLRRLLDDGLVRHIGLSNVNRPQLEEAVELAPIAAVELSLSVYDDQAVRGGMVRRCEELGIALIAHSPLGGPRRARRVAREDAQAALARLLELSPAIVPIPGARRPETARAAAAAAALPLSREASEPRPQSRRPATRADAEIVVVMGIQGAGKTRLATELVSRGYVRLNRDERGGKLRALAGALDEHLSEGASRIVLDNTYLTRASRSYVVEVAGEHGVSTRCLWLDIPLAQAQVNLVGRLIDRFGALPDPGELRRLGRREPGLLLPTHQMRSLRELEPPSLEEGFAAVERLRFVRSASADPVRAVFVAASALRTTGWREAISQADPASPHLIFDWNPDGDPAALDPLVTELGAEIAGPVQGALCAHGGGPPSCWCRPPLPGLPLAFARRHGADAGRSILIGTSPAHRTLAAALGSRYVALL